MDQQYAVFLEFVQFDFSPFAIDLKANSLAAFLRQFDKTDCANLSVKVFLRATENVALGLQHLHQKGLAQRDLKPSNVLVSNQHYCHLTNQEDIEKCQKLSKTRESANFNRSAFYPLLRSAFYPLLRSVSVFVFYPNPHELFS